ncbi:MAG TPA: hypothetical protein VG122_00025 [Gemmata sp.]|jgi:hypothetical protein|nr:hypothetical protein [Gemmata sp.]
MARNEFAEDVLSPMIGAVIAFVIVMFLVFFAVLHVRHWKQMGAKMTAAQKQDQNPGDERRPGGSGTLPNPKPGGPGTLPNLKLGGPAPKPSGPAAAPTLRPGLRETPPAGGFFATTDYREQREDGAILVGFDVGFGKVFNTDIIAYLRPIWLTARGEEYGTAYGRTPGPIATVKAQSGYAIGGIMIAGGGALEGFCLTFMRIGTKSLNANDVYTSDWYGERTRRPRPEAMRSGDGGFVVGFYGKRFDDKGGRNFDDGGAIATIGLVLWVKE